MQDRHPTCVFVRYIAFERRRLDHHGGGIVAGEMRGVDVKPDDPTRPGQFDDRMVVPAPATAAAFPAVHPFAVVVELALDKDRIGVVQHPL